MSISHTVTQFIESMIDEIDKQEYKKKIFLEAYTAFDNMDYMEFVSVLSEIGINCEPYQLETMRLGMEWAINDWLVNGSQDKILIKHFNQHYLNNNCGLHWTKFIKFVKNNWNQFDGVEISWNGLYRQYEIERKI